LGDVVSNLTFPLPSLAFPPYASSDTVGFATTIVHTGILWNHGLNRTYRTASEPHLILMSRVIGSVSNVEKLSHLDTLVSQCSQSKTLRPLFRLVRDCDLRDLMIFYRVIRYPRTDVTPGGISPVGRYADLVIKGRSYDIRFPCAGLNDL